MTGSLQIQNKKFYAVLNIKENGKRKQKWINLDLPVKGNKRLAQQKLAEILADYEEMQLTAPKRKKCDLTYLDYLRQWHKSIRGSVEDTTWIGYKMCLDSRITEFFQQENLMLCDLSPEHLQKFYNWMRELGLTGNTLVHYHAFIRKALNQAFKNDLVTENVADKVDRPKKDKFIASYYDKNELQELFAASKGDPLELIIFVTAYYGLRRSEVAGLKWGAVDFRNKTISIQHKVVETKLDNKMILIRKDKLKNASSHRILPLLPEVETRLLAERERQKKNRRLCKSAWKNDDDYIFVNDVGELIRPNFITQHFKILLKNKGVRVIRFHDLRHSCVKHRHKIVAKDFAMSCGKVLCFWV